MSGTDRVLVRQRRGWWIKVAKERLALKNDVVARAVGYKGKEPGTVVSRWESGERAVPSDRLLPLARVLQMPEDWMLNPPKTDLERLNDRLLELGRIVGEQEQSDWAKGLDLGQEADDELGDELDRGSA